MSRPSHKTCPACLIDAAHEATGNAFVIGLIASRHCQRKLCRRHGEFWRERAPAETGEAEESDHA